MANDSALLFPENEVARQRFEQLAAQGQVSPDQRARLISLVPPEAMQMAPTQVAAPPPRAGQVPMAPHNPYSIAHRDEQRPNASPAIPQADNQPAVSPKKDVSIPSGAGAFRRVAREAEGRGDEQKQGAQTVAELRTEAAVTGADVERDIYRQQYAAAKADLDAARLAQQQQQMALDKARQAQAQARLQIAELQDFAQYGQIGSLEEYQRLKATASDDSAPEAARKAAQYKLQKGREIDPSEWMGEEPWTKALVGLAMAVAAGMGGYASGILGGPNQAMQIMDGAIRRSIDKQKIMFRAHSDSANRKASLYGEMLQRLEGDEEAAASAMRVAGLSAVQAQAQMRELQYEDQRMKAGLQKAIADIEAEKQKSMQDIEQRVGAQAFQASLAGAQAQSRAAMETGKLRAREGSAGKGKALPASAATNVGGLKTAHDTLGDLMSQWKGLGGTRAGRYIDEKIPIITTDEKGYEQARKSAAQVIGRILEGGKLTDPDYARYYDMLPAPSDSDEIAAKKTRNLQALISNMSEGQVSALGGSGYDVSGITIPGQQSVPFDFQVGE